MPRKKPERGRPARPLPPRIDATPERIAEVVLGAKPKTGFFDSPTKTEYRCEDCKRVVRYPETLHEDGLCSGCTS